MGTHPSYLLEDAVPVAVCTCTITTQCHYPHSNPVMGREYKISQLQAGVFHCKIQTGLAILHT